MAKDKKEKKTPDILKEKTIYTAGAALASQRKQVEFNCAWCGKKQTGTSRKKYCDNRCKQAFKNDKAKGENQQ